MYSRFFRFRLKLVSAVRTSVGPAIQILEVSHVRRLRISNPSILLTAVVVLLLSAVSIGTLYAQCSPEQQKEAARGYQSAQTFLQTQQWDQAISRMQSIVEFCPDYAPAWRGLRDAYYNSGQLEMAERAGARTIEVQGDVAEAPDYAMMGKIYAKKKQYKAARAEYMKAERLAPNDCGVLFNLGVLHRAAGFTSDSVTTLQHAEQVCPRLRDKILPQLVESCKKAAIQQENIGNPEKAKYYEDLKNEYAGIAGGSTAFDIVRQKMQEKKFDEVVVLCDQMLAQKPDDTRALLTKARAADAAGRKTESIDAYKKYLALKPDDVRETVSLTLVMCETGQCSQAQTVASNAKKRFESMGARELGKVYFGWGKALECAEDYEFAKAKFNLCIASGDSEWVQRAQIEIGRMDQYIAYEKKKQQKDAQGG